MKFHVNFCSGEHRASNQLWFVNLMFTSSHSLLAEEVAVVYVTNWLHETRWLLLLLSSSYILSS